MILTMGVSAVEYLRRSAGQRSIRLLLADMHARRIRTKNPCPGLILNCQDVNGMKANKARRYDR